MKNTIDFASVFETNPEKLDKIAREIHSRRGIDLTPNDINLKVQQSSAMSIAGNQQSKARLVAQEIAA